MSEYGGIGPNEVSLNSQIYKLVRGTMVQEKNAISNAIVVRTGAEGLHDETATSGSAIDDFSGGMGKIRGKRGQDDNRFAYSTWDVRRNGQVTLPPLATDSLALSSDVFFLDFEGYTYAMGSGIRRIESTTWKYYDTGTDTWVSTGGSAKALTAAAVSAVVFKGALYVLEGTAMDSYDGGITWSMNIDSGRDGKYGVVYDDKIVVISPAGAIYSSTDGSTWVTGGTLTTPATITSMCLYLNKDGETTIHVGTSDGLYAYDFWTQKFYKLIDLSHRPHAWNCRGMYSDGDVLYVPEKGGAVMEWRPGIKVYSGANRDDGMPSGKTGSVLSITPVADQVFAAHDAGSGTSTILVKRGSGWSVHHEADAANEEITTTHYTTLNTPHRLYFCQGTNIWYLEEPVETMNPLQYSSQPYAASAIHTTCDMDCGRPHMTKLALSLTFLMENANSNEKISNIEYRINYGSWVTTGLSATTVTAIGSTEITFGSGQGTAFKTIAFRLTMVRGATTTNRPIFVSAVLKFLYIPKTVAGARVPRAYSFWVDITRTARHTGNSGEDLITNLDTALTSETLIPFYYGQSSTVQVTVRGLQKNLVLPKKGGSVASDRKGTALVSVEEVM